VTSVEWTPRGVVNNGHRGNDTYDHVVIASHRDQPVAMPSDADDRERAILGAIGCATNTIYSHRGIKLVFGGSVFPSFASAFSGKIMPRHSPSGEAISARAGRTRCHRQGEIVCAAPTVRKTLPL
jgi:hypothetical protein